MSKTYPIKLWCVVDPCGRIVSASPSRYDCYSNAAVVLPGDDHARRKNEIRAAVRAGWRVRRLKPEEVEP